MDERRDLWIHNSSGGWTSLPRASGRFREALWCLRPRTWADGAQKPVNVLSWSLAPRNFSGPKPLHEFAWFFLRRRMTRKELKCCWGCLKEKGAHSQLRWNWEGIDDKDSGPFLTTSRDKIYSFYSRSQFSMYQSKSRCSTKLTYFETGQSSQRFLKHFWITFRAVLPATFCSCSNKNILLG